jgi:hypothetical protein
MKLSGIHKQTMFALSFTYPGELFAVTSNFLPQRKPYPSIFPSSLPTFSLNAYEKLMENIFSGLWLLLEKQPKPRAH